MSRANEEKMSTGVAGLDEVLGGGLPAGGLFLLQGAPGVGKTTLALQFLAEGRDRGQSGMYAALTETRSEVESVAAAHGWSLDGISIWEPGVPDRQGSPQTFFHPADVELEEMVQPMMAEIERTRPTRLVIDSLSEIRLLAREGLRYRRQLLAFKQLFLEHGCTVLLIDTKPGFASGPDGILETLIGGVVVLEKTRPVYGSTRRRLIVDKVRGAGFREGYHDFQIETGGIVVHPRLVAAQHEALDPADSVSSGVQALDDLLGGGLDRGTSTLVVGPSGAGKSSLATQYVHAGLLRGEAAAVFVFEETIRTWLARCTSLGFDLAPAAAEGRLHITQVDPAELSPGELATNLRRCVEHRDVKLVVLDSLNGYLQSVPEESFLLLHLHELLTYLAHRNVTTIVNVAQYGLLGPAMTVPVDISYLADTVLLLRYFEASGEVRQAISVVKKRTGRHERAIREFKLEAGGVRVGEPLREFHGVLTGVPTYAGGGARLLNDG